MIFSIDGSSRLPKLFQFFQSTPYFYDLVLATVDERFHMPGDSANMTATSLEITNAIAVPSVTLARPVDVSFNDASANAASSQRSSLVDPESLLELNLDMNRWSNIPDGSSLHEQTQSTNNDAISINNSTVMSNENNDDGRPAVLYWEKECHRNLLAQHSAVIRDILIKAWNEIDKKLIDDHAEIIDPLYRAAMCRDEERRFLRLELKEMKASSLETIFDFIYTGQLRFEEENFGSLLEDASRWGFQLVVELCQDHLAQSVNIANWDNLLTCGYNSGNDGVVMDCFNYIQTNLCQSKETSRIMQSMKRLTFPIILKLMSSNMLQEENAEAFIEMATTWVEADIENRMQYLNSLLVPKVQLLSFEVLWELGKSELINSDDSSFQLVMKTLITKQPSTFVRSSSSNSRNISDRATKTSVTTQTSFSLKRNSSLKETIQTDSKNAGRSQLAQINSITVHDKQPNQTVATTCSLPPEEETLIVLSNSRDVNGNGIIEKYHPDENKWSGWKTSHSLDWGFEVQVLENLLICMGGGLLHGKEAKHVKVLNFISKEWTSGPDLNIGRTLFGSCVINRCEVLVCGGLVKSNSKVLEPTNTCEVLRVTPHTSKNYHIGEWDMLPPMKTTRYGYSAASIKNQAFVVGGITLYLSRQSTTSSVERFDFTKRNWTEVSSMKEPRAHCAVATYQETIFVFGGLNGSKRLHSCERYNPELDYWECISTLPSPRSSCTAGVLGRKIFIIGGRGSNLYNNLYKDEAKQTDVYDVEKRKWYRGAGLVDQLDNTKCIAVRRMLAENLSLSPNLKPYYRNLQFS